MTRSERRKEANKRLIRIVLEINGKFRSEFNRTKDLSEAVRLTESFIRAMMRIVPQEQHMWERAAIEWDENLSNRLDKVIEEANK